MMKRFLAMLLTVVMVISLLPVSILAEGSGTPAPQAEQSKAEAHTKYSVLTSHIHVEGDAHICEHCIAAGKSEAEAKPTWIPWGDDEAEKKNLPTESGHYYITEDLSNMTTTDLSTGSGKDVVICLNGKRLNCNDAYNASNRFYTLGSTNKLTILDCTAHTDSNGDYVAGSLNNGTYTTIFFKYEKGNATFTMYDGIIANSTQRNANGGAPRPGGAILVQGPSRVNLYGGEIRNAKASSGGAIRLYSKGAVLDIDGAAIRGCEATGQGSAILASESTDKAGSDPTQITIRNATITGNKNTQLTGDECGGAVYVNGNTAVVTLGGNNQITGNTDKDGAAYNLFLKNDTAGQPKYTISGLSSTAKMGIRVAADRVTAADGLILSTALGGADVTNNFVADNIGYELKLENDALVLAKGQAHIHKLCNGHEGCIGCTHTELTYEKWDKEDSLPTTGSYYLTCDVTLSTQVKPTGTLNLCLNGHTITVKEGSGVRHFWVENNANLNICNCSTQKEGVLTGGQASAVMTSGDSTKKHTGQVNLYNVVFTGNTYSNGGAIMLQGSTKLTAVGCKINGNTATNSGGAVRVYSIGNTATFIDCQINGNTAKTMTAIRLDNGTLKLVDTVVEGNQSSANSGDATYGAVYAPNNTNKTLIVSGTTRIIGNTDKDGKPANVFFQNVAGNQAVLTVDGLTGNAMIGVSLQKARLAAADGLTVTAKLNGADPSDHFSSDNDAYMPVLKDDTIVLGSVDAYAHKHKSCGEAGCTDHADVVYQPWEMEDSLPASGSYYLTKDVEISAQTTLDGTALNLCLNGHTITVKEGSGARHFSLKNSAKLVLCNCSTEKDGVLTGGENSALMTENKAANASVIEMYNIVLTGNSYSNGGAIMLQGSSGLTMTGCKLNGNTATNSGGALRLYGTGKTTLIDCEIKNNTAPTMTAIRQDNGTLELINTVIEGNHSATKAGEDTYGAVYIPNNDGKQLIVSGTTRITGNTDKDGKPANVCFQNAKDKQAVLTVDGLTGNAMIGMTLREDRLEETDGRAITAKLNGKDYTAFFAYDSDLFEILLKDDVLVVEEKSDHYHKLCCDGTCTDHSDVKFLPWKDSGKLPRAGNYYLETDVQLGAVATVSGQLNLCLNGHTITAKKNERHFDVRADAVLTITDCKTTGKITGGVRAFGGASVNVNAGAVFNLYGGELTGNEAVLSASDNALGGAVFLYQPDGTNPGAVFNMYGGSITNNSAIQQGGAVFCRSGSVFNMYGGTIRGNTAERGGAIATAAGATVNIHGGTISENTASGRGGALYVTNAQLNISGGNIEKNTATGSGGAIMAASGSVITMTGGKLSANNGSTGGAILMENADTAMNMSGGEISGNHGSYCGGVYASTGTSFTMSGGKIADNTSNSSGGGLFLLRSNVTISGGEISGNTATGNGGGVEIEGAKVTISGGKISGNKAVNGGGVYITYTKHSNVTYQPTVSLQDCQITGNTATGMGGGVTTRDNDFEKLELSGQLVITDNMAGDRLSNLYLPGKATFTVGTMGNNAKVGIRMAAVYGTAGLEAEEGDEKFFQSDDTALKVIYKDSTICLDVTEGHTHCLCADKSAHCKHEAVNFAPWSDPKHLPNTAGNYYLTVDVQLSAVCSINGDVNLCLNGHTITPKNNERTFVVNPGRTLSVTDCTGKGVITGGVRNYGGVINVNQDATFNLYGGKLTGNKTVDMTNEKGKCGAVYLTKEQVGYKVGDQILTEKPAEGTAYEEVITAKGGIFNMYGGEISDNTAYRGGAVYLCNGTTMNMYGGTIANNAAMERGGAISTDVKVVLNIYGGTITGNTASKGGAIYIRDDSQVTVSGGLITKNKTQTTTYEGKTVAKGSGAGAISVTGGATLTVTGGEISYNSAAGAGGAILVESQDSKLVLKGGKLLGNETTSSGGAIYVSRNTVFEMTGGSVTGNIAKGNGGGLYLLRCKATISGGSISYNTSTQNSGGGIGMGNADLDLRGGTIGYNKTLAKAGKGAGILMNGSRLNFSGGTIIGNQLHESSTGGAAICTSTASETTNGVKTVFYSKINMTGGTICEHTGRNGGALLLQTQTEMNMSGGSFRDNHATVDGGAVCLYSKSVFNMTGGEMTGNSADSRGGCIYYSAGTSGSITGGNATGNKAGKYGGFVNAHGIDTKLVIKDMKLTGNESGNYGGALAMTWNAALEMENCEFFENTAKEGGAMYLAHKTICDLTNVKIYKNYSSDAGGGLYLDVGNNIHLTNVQITENEAAGNGGAVYTRANVHLKDCLIDGNKSGKDGGAIATSKAWTYGNLPEHTAGYVGRGQGMILENCTITNNECVGRGGGVFMAKGNWNTVINSTFTGNVCGETGSALFVGDDLLVQGGMTVTGNTSKTDGYAVYFRENFYDGQSYIQTIHEIGGNVIIKDNKGGDAMLCKDVVLGNTKEAYGPDTYINITLSDGLLTNRVLGQYNYEGEDPVYIITCGTRSYDEPMVTEPVQEEAPEQTESQEQSESRKEDNTLLYVGIGGIAAVVILAAVILVLVKKKKTGNATGAGSK